MLFIFSAAEGAVKSFKVRSRDELNPTQPNQIYFMEFYKFRVKKIIKYNKFSL